MEIVTNTPAAEVRVRQHFDNSAHLYINKQLACYRESVEQRLQLLRTSASFKDDAKVNILDVGCGAGLFLDMFLENFPNARATGIDLSIEMMRQNAPSKRKRLLIGDALALPGELGEFDVICIDTVMHHLISSAGYERTIRRIQEFLESLQRHLRPGGVLLIREIYHEYLAIHDFGSRAIFAISTLQVPPLLESWIKRAGIHTANAGVCFLTREQWARVFERAGFYPIAIEDYRWPGQPYRKFGFTASGDLHYILRRNRPLL
jgi:SAM-dependent methyltransferase